MRRRTPQAGGGITSVRRGGSSSGTGMLPNLGALSLSEPTGAWPESQPMPEPVLQDWLADAHGLLCALSTPINATLLEKASRLQVISTISVGVDHIDITAATRLGIPVGHSPGVLVDSTADLALGLMLAVTRRMAEADRWIRAGNWAQGWQSDLLLGTDLIILCSILLLARSLQSLFIP